MLLSVINFSSGKTISYKIIDIANSEIQAYTSTGVRERHEIPLSEGTATTGTTGTTLIDNTADFVTDGIAAGDFVYNTNDDTKTTVSSVTDLNTLVLNGSIFAVGEAYSIGDSLGNSIYEVTVSNTITNNDGTPFEGHVIWKTADTVPLTAVETINLLNNTLDPEGSVVSDGSNAANTFKTDLPETDNDYWKNTWVRFQSGALKGQIQKVTSYDGSTKFLSFTDSFTATPVAATTFKIINE